ncbi:hypothetical protein TIFTF001_056314, partial [Ficus carica]
VKFAGDCKGGGLSQEVARGRRTFSLLAVGRGGGGLLVRGYGQGGLLARGIASGRGRFRRREQFASG